MAIFSCAINTAIFPNRTCVNLNYVKLKYIGIKFTTLSFHLSMLIWGTNSSVLQNVQETD